MAGSLRTQMVLGTMGRPWGRLFSREVWRRLEFPEGYWFEDTVINIRISPVFKEKNLGEPVYLYRENQRV